MVPPPYAIDPSSEEGKDMGSVIGYSIVCSIGVSILTPWTSSRLSGLTTERSGLYQDFDISVLIRGQDLKTPI